MRPPIAIRIIQFPSETLQGSDILQAYDGDAMLAQVITDKDELALSGTTRCLARAHEKLRELGLTWKKGYSLEHRAVGKG